ncbi:hypothetical protein CANINC_002101 [Pichia inconspicua]|uniref:Aspartate aminotransferase n=1 Tax=Pichia inconspicua TaxID=52247 RepID=A0A4T0X2E2_9ASCO|nr:hypothetical protein CANINC_002101 [[Candida] inconspicua]
MRSSIRKLSYFRKVTPAAPDAILGLTSAYAADNSAKSHKMNLGVGAYRDDNGDPWVLPSVAQAEQIVLADKKYNHEYAPILGSTSFVNEVKKLLFAQTPNAEALLNEGRIVTGQGISGTGSLRVLAEFISGSATTDTGGVSINRIAVPAPTWANHKAVLANAGLQVVPYSYYNAETRGLHIEALLNDLATLHEGDAVLLHACCHNPTGVDPTSEDWDKILATIAKSGALPVFDLAYQGFGAGLVEDLDALEKACTLVRSGDLPNLVLAQSFAKNMGLYGERVGSFSLITASETESNAVESQVKKTVRSMYSSPPAYGAKIVQTVLSNEKIHQQWVSDVAVMRDRLRNVRETLYNELQNCGGPKWDHLVQQKGMFCYTGLTKDQVRALRERSVYMTDDGRISVAGINSSNVKRLAQEIAKVSSV